MDQSVGRADAGCGSRLLHGLETQTYTKARRGGSRNWTALKGASTGREAWEGWQLTAGQGRGRGKRVYSWSQRGL